MGYLILAVVAAFVALGGVAKCEHARAETALEQVAVKDQHIKTLTEANAKAEADVKESKDAVAKLRAEEAARIAAGAAAARNASRAIDALEKGLQAQLAAKPAFPEDTCKSACSALRQPL